jgi:hypothetical protein
MGARKMFDSQRLEDAFRAWFAESYPNAQPSKHTVMSHVAFAQYILQKNNSGDQEKSV